MKGAGVRARPGEAWLLLLLRRDAERDSPVERNAIELHSKSGTIGMWPYSAYAGEESFLAFAIPH